MTTSSSEPFVRGEGSSGRSSRGGGDRGSLSGESPGVGGAHNRPVVSGLNIRPRRVALLMALGYILLLAPFLGLSSIGGSSEARETHVAAIIRDTGEWVLPLRNGVVPSKPPFFHWVTAALGEAYGAVTPAVARGTSLLFGAGVIYLTVLLGIRLSSGVAVLSREQSTAIGLGAGFVLASTYGFTQLALDARVDMTYTFFVVLAVYALLAPFSRESVVARGRTMPLTERDFALFFGACGGAILAKGPIGFVLPTVIAGGILVYLVGWRVACGACLRPRFSWLLLVALALPWYLAAAARGDAAFIERQIIFENLKRFTGAEHMNNEPPWFYFGSLLRSAFPWSLVFIAHLGLVPWVRPAATPYGEGRLPGARLRASGAVWFLLGFIFLSLASGKRHSYLLPLYSGLSIFVAWCTVELLGRFDDAARATGLKRMGVINRALAGVALLLGCSVCGFIVVGEQVDPSWELIRRWLESNAHLIGAACGVIMGLQLAGLTRIGQGRSFVSLSAAATIVWLLGAAITGGYGIKSELKGFDRMSIEIATRLEPHDEVVLLKTPYNEYFDPFLFYLGRAVRIAPPIRSSIVCDGKTRHVARSDWFSNLEAEPTLPVREIHTAYQTYDAMIGRRDRGIVLFECGTTPIS